MPRGSPKVSAIAAIVATGDPDALTGFEAPAGAPVVALCGAGKVSLVAAAQLRERGIDARSLVGSTLRGREATTTRGPGGAPKAAMSVAASNQTSGVARGGARARRCRSCEGLRALGSVSEN